MSDKYILRLQLQLSFNFWFPKLVNIYDIAPGKCAEKITWVMQKQYEYSDNPIICKVTEKNQENRNNMVQSERIEVALIFNKHMQN